MFGGPWKAHRISVIRPFSLRCPTVLEAIDPGLHGRRAVIVVHAELVRDSCGYAVPHMAYEADRDLHAKRFSREDDACLDAYFTRKEHIATSLDGLPGLPLPLPPSTV
ncbi:hypothetical protein S1361_08650 [Streptomyces cyanogenus]|uniref:Uncharacterized protein n=1 Tax=Streptomyces cyanogenus TaxID=80860 RepID=A0ABX7TPA3_STRCY|nr:hypothetical protein S1361_08650 [Streptomyces cyanogenus]